MIPIAAFADMRSINYDKDDMQPLRDYIDKKYLGYERVIDASG